MKFKKYMEDGGKQQQELEVHIDGDGAHSSQQTDAPSPPIETIHMDVELFIRVLEYARENSKTDQELHQMTERAAELCRGRTLTMQDYEALVANLRREPDDPNAVPSKEYQTMKTSPAFDSDKPTDVQSFGGGSL